MEAFGIKGALLNWFTNWLIGRRQRVVLEGQSSDWTKVTSSVPQGSVLGPILFLIFIDDLRNVVKSNLSLFADDTKLFRTIKTPHDRSTLQKDINSMVEWSKTWLMEFNKEKCQVLSFGKGNPPIYTLGKATLNPSRCEKDVGVLVPTNLKFEEQCSAAISKANSVLGQIKRAFHTRDTGVILNAFKTYVLPHLDYCCQAWSPASKKWITKIEKVQKRALKMIPSLGGLSYIDKLKSLQMLSLENRRILFDLSTMFSMQKDQISNPNQSGMKTRSIQNEELPKPKFRLDIRKNSHLIRTTDQWNLLPKEVRKSNTLFTFKKKCKELLLTKQNAVIC